ncbi:isochorismate synthase [Conexibacter sp. JD483]|uniref:isochorismate synthase n=1 Tax=unclassified Conexibacter TaxID=2627773 RepID=UPI002717789B|nr:MULTISPECIES: isochorismate synthase [unclassified Conexibacter]MDO8185749.1 isochorismate synthase [Conexibacter sp. CPCC 205706]MDO8199126.1 isochorismate synthase [Conexibacter sp. CPCC 205762]MDR9370980.1 isochorismate synthase [Conexibacter sp. JD483]
MRVRPASPQWLDRPARELLAQRLQEAVRRARAGAGTRGGASATGEALAAVTVGVARGIDPTAVVVASRDADEPWYALEQPDRDGTALATLGCVRALEASGPDRFETVASAWRMLAADAVSDPPEGPAGAGLVAVGGFAFAPGGGTSPVWSGFAPASLHVPRIAFARRGRDVRLTVAALCTPDDDPDQLLAAIEARLERLVAAPALPLLDPAPAGRYRVVSAMPPEHYEGAVARATERIRAGELEKVVLAREVQVHAPVAHDAGAVFGALREGFPGCYVYAVGRGEATFLGATPELLVRREGERASTVALAGSTRRSADPAVDDHLGEALLRSDKDRGEQAIVTRRIARALRPHSVWVTAAPEPVVVRVANIQHLATPIRAQLSKPLAAVRLVDLLHPTPAVGGEPFATAERLIPQLEGFDRGWYAGPVGWIDTGGDGEFCVALRCALLRGPIAHLYAGVGVVRDSDPASELAETEIKLQALLPVLAG